MKRQDKSLILFSVIGLSLSGIILYSLINFFPIETRYGLRANPFLDHFKFIHNLMGVMTIFFLGLIFHGHVLTKLKGRYFYKKISGIFLLFGLFFLTISGFLLQFFSDTTLRDLTSSLHFYTGLTFFLGFFFHLLFKKP